VDRSCSTSCGAASWFIRTTNVLMLVIFVPSVPLQQLIYYYSVCLRAPTVGGFAPHIRKNTCLEAKRDERVQTFKKNLGEIITDHVISMLEIPDVVTEGRPSESSTDKKCGVATKSRFTSVRSSWYEFTIQSIILLWHHCLMHKRWFL